MDSQVNGDNEPLILQEINKLVESLDDNQQQRVRLELFLDQKQICYEELQQQEKTIKSSNASKNTSLATAQHRQRYVNEKNVHYRSIVDEICESVNEAYQNIYEIGDNLASNQDKLSHTGKNSDENVKRYEKNIDELIIMLNKLTEKRKQQLNELDLQMAEARKENMELNCKTAQNEQLLLNCDDFDDSEDIERELTELQSKLSILHEDYTTIGEEESAIDAANEELAENFQESTFNAMDSQLSDIVLEVQQFSQCKDLQKTAEQKLTTFYQFLDDHGGPNYIWTSLQQNHYMLMFSKLHQEIGEIRADSIGRNLKYGAGEEIYVDNLESLKEIDQNIQATSSEVAQLTSELNDVEKLLDSREVSNNLTQQAQDVISRIDDLHREKAAIQASASATDEEIQRTIDQLPKEADQGELAILTFENTSLLEVKELNKKYTEVQETRAKLEAEIKSSENQLTQLEVSKNQREREADLLSEKKKDLDRLIQSKISATHPKKPTTKHAFMRPNAPESTKRNPKTAKSPLSKRNWDSDSSMEGEIVNLSDFLKTKQKKRRSTDK